MLTGHSLVQQGNLRNEHAGDPGGVDASQIPGSGAISDSAVRAAKTLQLLSSSARQRKRPPCAEGGCGRGQNWLYGKYCAKHAREHGLQTIRMPCLDPGCPRQGRNARSGYCTKHARQHGVPFPARCSRACCARKAYVAGICKTCADGGIPSQLRPCVFPGCPELGTHKRHWLCSTHLKESEQKPIGQPCATPGCGLNRNIGYHQFCTKHGRENGLLQERMMCKADDCDHRAILASVGYCAKDARKLGIKIPKYHCSEPDCLGTPLKYGGQCRKCILRAA
jgi:hypothetical protein